MLCMYLHTVLCTGMGIIKSHNSTPVKNAKMIEMIAVHCRCNKDSAGTARYVMLKQLFCCFLVLQHKQHIIQPLRSFKISLIGQN